VTVIAIISAVLAVGAIGYFLLALLRPERF
jgi:K+-transporting ATPase KdpF subunit